METGMKKQMSHGAFLLPPGQGTGTPAGGGIDLRSIPFRGRRPIETA